MLLLVALGVGLYFWLSDPRRVPGWHGADVVDAIAQASPGTWVGVAGCGLVAAIGAWLVVRRAV